MAFREQPEPWPHGLGKQPDTAHGKFALWPSARSMTEVGLGSQFEGSRFSVCHGWGILWQNSGKFSTVEEEKEKEDNANTDKMKPRMARPMRPTVIRLMVTSLDDAGRTWVVHFRRTYSSVRK